MNRFIAGIMACMMMLPMAACGQAPREEYVQPAEGEKLTDDQILNMFEVNGQRISFPLTLSDLTAIDGVTSRRMYNIDYPDDIDITVRLYCKDLTIGYALHDKDGNISDITFIDNSEDNIVHVNGIRLSDHASMQKLLLPLIDSKSGEYSSVGRELRLSYSEDRISLSLGNKEHKSFTGTVTTDQGPLPPSWDTDKLLSSLSVGGTPVKLPCSEEDIMNISGVKLERDISEDDPTMVGIREDGDIIGYYKVRNENEVYCLTLISKGTAAIDGVSLSDTADSEKVLSVLFEMNVSDYVTRIQKFTGDKTVGIVYNYEPGNASVSMEVLE